MVGLHNPASQGQPTPGLSGSFPRRPDHERNRWVAEHRRNTGRDRTPRVVVVTPNQDVGRRRSAAVPQGLDRLGRRPLRFQLFDLLQQWLGKRLEGLVALQQLSDQLVPGKRLLLLGQRLPQTLSLDVDPVLNVIDLNAQPVVLGLVLVGDNVQPTNSELVSLLRASDRFQPVVLVKGPLEDRGQPVIVPLRDRVVLVIVTPCALDGQPQHDGAEHIKLVGDDVEPIRDEGHLTFTGAVGRHSHEARRHQVLINLLADFRRVLVIDQFIACELFHQETVVGPVAVEGADHVVPIPPRVRPHVIGLKLPAKRIGIAHRVEPVAAPAFAVAGRGEQPIDQASERPGAIVIEKLLQL